MIFFPAVDKEDLRTGEGHAKGREKQEAARGILQTLPHLCGTLSLITYVQEQVCSTPANMQSQQRVLATSALFPLNLFTFRESSFLPGTITCSD